MFLIVNCLFINTLNIKINITKSYFAQKQQIGSCKVQLNKYNFLMI